MTKAKTIICSAVLMILAVSAFAGAISVQGGSNVNRLLGAQAYTLNILGKKLDFNGQPAYDSERHTMFVPEDLEAWKEQTGMNATVWLTQGTEFLVADPNMFDDGHCNFTLGPGKYQVFFVALGKPGYTTTLEGWIYNVTGNEYLLKLGEVTVSHSKRPDWQNGTSMFYVTVAEAAALGITITEDMWVFEFLQRLAETYPGTEYLYLWNLIGGLKHIQVRFYLV